MLEKELSAFICDIDFETLTDEDIQHGKLLILDALGCMIQGSTLPWSKIVIDYVGSLAAKEEACVFASRVRTTVGEAGFANGGMAHAFELDDTYFAGGHPGCGIIPTALAVGESVSATGQRLLSAISVASSVT